MRILHTGPGAIATGATETTRTVGDAAAVAGDPAYDNLAQRLVVNSSQGKVYPFSVPF